MKINTEIIKALNPCDSRFNNYLNYYSNFDGTLEDFILLDNISYNDKVWVFNRLATKEQNAKWALLCASKVLSIFETECPNDDRPRKALESVENYLNNPCEETRSAAEAAAMSVTRSAEAWTARSTARSAAAWSALLAAWSAARSAAWSAEAAESATSAAWSAAKSAARSAEAAESATSAAEAADIEEEVNLLFMVEAIK